VPQALQIARIDPFRLKFGPFTLLGICQIEQAPFSILKHSCIDSAILQDL
jgi:hypothetical protein